MQSNKISYLTHALFVFIQKASLKKHTYDIGIIDDAYCFHEEHITILSTAITYCCYSAMCKVFNRYHMTNNTEIVLLQPIQKKDVIYMYMSMIMQNISDSSVRSINVDLIPRRIVAYHNSYLGRPKKASQISKYYIERLWKKLVTMQKCPWITFEIDQMLSNKSIDVRKRSIVVRLGLYYMSIKRFLTIRYKHDNNESQISTIEQTDEKCKEDNSI